MCTTVDKLNLGQYTAPLVSSIGGVVGPHYQTASKNLLPILSPYMDLAAPYIGGAKPHLDRVSQKEAMLIIGQTGTQREDGRAGASGAPVDVALTRVLAVPVYCV